MNMNFHFTWQKFIVAIYPIMHGSIGTYSSLYTLLLCDTDTEIFLLRNNFLCVKKLGDLLVSLFSEQKILGS